MPRQQTAVEFLLEVQKGHIPKHSIWRMLGEFELGTVTVNGEDVCRFRDFTPSGPARLPSPSLLGEKMTVISESNADNGATATGVLSVRIHYLDVNGDQQIEDVVMNGTSAVDTVADDIIFVNDFHTMTVGTNGVAEGSIAIYKKGSTIPLSLYNMIEKGGNKSLVPHRMTPIGHTLFLVSWSAEETKDKRAWFRLRATCHEGHPTPGVFNFIDTVPLSKMSSGQRDLIFYPIPEMQTVKVSQWGDQLAAEGGCSIIGVLVDNR